MKYIKRVLPLLLAALILFGGIYGGYALRAAIPSYKGTIVEAEKNQKENPLLLIDSEETITFSPWDQYDPQECQSYNSFLAEGNDPLIESLYAPEDYITGTLYNYLYHFNENDSNVETEGDPHSYEMLFNIIYNGLQVQTIEDFGPSPTWYFLRETKITTAETDYYVKAAMSGEFLLYFSCRKSSESATPQRLSSEKLQKAASSVNSYFTETLTFVEEFQKSEDIFSDPYGDQENYFWKNYFSKVTESSPLDAFLYSYTLHLNLDDIFIMLESKKDILAYQNQILVVFSSPEFYIEPGFNPRTLILFYDPIEEAFTGFSSSA